MTPDSTVGKHFVHEDLLSTLTSTSGAQTWQQATFWEQAFIDMVAQEREVVGVDEEPSEMLDRYASLSEGERKRLEMEEDRILATLLHNMTVYMVACCTPVKTIQQKARRLLGKAHIGLIYSKQINQLLDDLQPGPSTGGVW